jgi:uncharacterized membrane protein required for colicin V production
MDNCFCGLAKTIIHLIAWIGGALGVIYAPEFLGPFLAENFSFSETTLIILTRVLGFLVPFILLRILGHFVNKFIKRHFSLVNALGGGILGFIKGIIPCVILLSTLYLLPLSGTLKTQRDTSFSYNAYTYVLRKSGAEQKIQDTQNSIRETFESKVEEAAEEAVNKAAASAKETAKETAKKAADKAASKIQN